MYFIITGQTVGFFTEMIVPRIKAYVLPKVMALFNKGKSDKKSSESNSIGIDTKTLEAKDVMTEAENKFMQKVYNEVAMDEYNIYTDYVEMVIQV